MSDSQLIAHKDTPELDPNVTYGDFRDDLARHGWCVVPGVLSNEKCDSYISRMNAWLESFGLGYQRDDPSTWSEERLPVSYRGGLFNQYGVGHEQFMWDLRSEPNLVAQFSKLWGTEDLLVGYDGCNISLPFLIKPGDRMAKPWPHVDQSPLRTHMHCVQGIINLYENGPQDGGLMVLRESHKHYVELFYDKFAKDKPENGWTVVDIHRFSDEQMKWLESRPGAEWHKVCAKPGDLLLWDSRVCHYGSPPMGTNPRIAAYVCYKPASMITPELLASKLQLFDEMQNTGHDGTLPFKISAPVPPVRRGHDGIDPAWLVRQVPDERPLLGERAKKLAGLEPYPGLEDLYEKAQTIEAAQPKEDRDRTGFFD
ncbi:hypothetical protein BKA62DRAFT_753892 [Auriculariales sp. MPI-PUGE-AT-0066]|nr:hypothetical protein BKA62DRAFT_753892 [Auriculariales sp. MPI-PUGE-AT-0066]